MTDAAGILGKGCVATKVGAACSAVALLIALTSVASAQTYGTTNYPVCLQNYFPIQFIECSFVSVPQCNASASGRPATCILNPYFDPSQLPTRRKRYR